MSTAVRIDGCRTVDPLIVKGVGSRMGSDERIRTTQSYFTELDLILNCLLHRIRVVIAWVDGCSFLGSIPKGTRGAESVVFFSRNFV